MKLAVQKSFTGQILYRNPGHSKKTASRKVFKNILPFVPGWSVFRRQLIFGRYKGRDRRLKRPVEVQLFDPFYFVQQL